MNGTDQPTNRLWGITKRPVAGITGLALAGLLMIGGGHAFAANGISVNATATPAAAVTTTRSVADIAEAANKAVVTVLNLQAGTDQMGNPTGDLAPVGSGSGFIVDAAGYVITNNHVVEGGQGYQVTFEDGTTVDATLVGSDPYQDVAVLQLQLADGQQVPGILAFGDSDTVRAGDEVIALGTPYGEFNNTVTDGMVGAVERTLDSGTGTVLPNLIQHGAPIYPGNSGGPLLNLQGEVIGMNVAKMVNPQTGQATDDALNFAIEGNAVRDIARELVKTGHFDRAYLGVQVDNSGEQPVVAAVEPDGPAAAAGLQAGDVVVSVDGQELTPRDSFQQEILFDHRPGDDVSITVKRNGAEVVLTAHLTTRPEVQPTS